MAKKYYISLIITCLAAAALTACGREELPEESALEVSEDGTTALGIGPGSTFGEFLEAYGQYPMDMVAGDGTWTDYEPEKTSKDTEPSGEDGRYAIACFYEDGAAKTTEELAEEAGTGVDELEDYLSSPEYLGEHSLVYRYVFFDVSDNTVQTVSGDYLDYNSEVYQEE